MVGWLGGQMRCGGGCAANGQPGGGGVVADEVFDVGVWWGINWLMLGDVLRDQMFEFGVVWGSSIKFEVWWIIKCSILSVMGVSNVHSAIMR